MVEIPFSSLKTSVVYAASYHLVIFDSLSVFYFHGEADLLVAKIVPPQAHMDPLKKEKAGTIHLSILFTMKEKSAFLDKISKVQTPIRDKTTTAANLPPSYMNNCSFSS